MINKIQETESLGAVNAMGSSSSVAGTGGIDTLDPLLKTTMLKRKPSKLSDIIGPRARLKDMQRDKK